MGLKSDQWLTSDDQTGTYSPIIVICILAIFRRTVVHLAGRDDADVCIVILGSILDPTKNIRSGSVCI